MDKTFLSPSAKRSVPALPDPNTFPPNGSSKRARSSSKTQPPPLSVPQGHVAFRLLCQASRIGGVIGKSGSVIKSLQQSTGTKIRIEDAPAEVQDRLIVVVGEGTISGRVSLSGGEAVEVSKAQEALLKVFDRILEVAAETEGIEVGDRVVCSRLVADAAQVGSVIGKGGKIVDKIRKDTGCRIRAFTDNSAPSTSSSDEVIECLEGARESGF
nr:KH domain-containing protein HEN4 [Arachis hypogaea]